MWVYTWPEFIFILYSCTWHRLNIARNEQWIVFLLKVSDAPQTESFSGISESASYSGVWGNSSCESLIHRVYRFLRLHVLITWFGYIQLYMYRLWLYIFLVCNCVSLYFFYFTLNLYGMFRLQTYQITTVNFRPSHMVTKYQSVSFSKPVLCCFSVKYSCS